MDIVKNETAAVGLFGEALAGKVDRDEPAITQAENQPRAKARLKPIDRRQMVMRTIDMERLVEADHPVRAMWEMLGQVDLAPFMRGVRAVEGRPGQATVDPRLLASLWIYAYSEGISSARELSRMCEYEPGCQWLTGMGTVNHHTLSDFRVEHKEAMDGVFAEVLGLLSAEGLVELKQVTLDGTKVKANAGKDTFRREERVEKHLELARKQIEQMGDPRSEDTSQRTAKAKERVLREKRQRLEQAMEELKRIQEAKPDKQRAEARVSTTDPESRVMKNSDGGYIPAYNVQVTTCVAHGIVLDLQAVQGGSDRDQLMPAVDRLEEKLGVPGRMITDAGYTSHNNIESTANRHIDLIAPVPEGSTKPQQYEERGIGPAFHNEAFQYDPAADHYVCPAGKTLKPSGKHRFTGRIQIRYQARPSECSACPFRDQCCPKAKSRRITRSQDSETVKAFIAKMQTEEAKQIYRQRAPVAEFVNAWIKDKLGLRQFRLRGLAKVQVECVWAGLTYNIQQWIRLCWRPRVATA
jgi:transposase